LNVRNSDLQEAYLNLKRKLKDREIDLRKTEKGMLIIEKQQLEENIKLLSEEVEMLSVKNERLLKDLRTKDFYQTYNSVLEEVSNLTFSWKCLRSRMLLSSKRSQEAMKAKFLFRSSPLRNKILKVFLLLIAFSSSCSVKVARDREM